MSDAFTVHERALAEALDAPVPDIVHTRLNAVLRTAPVKRGVAPSRRLTLSLATIAVAAVVAALWITRPTSDAERAYAAVIKALEGVDTVHITGWTTQVDQRWYSSRDEALDDGTRYELATWEWMTDEGVSQSYSKQGPIILVIDGDRRYEFDTRHDHLSIWQSHPHEFNGQRFRNLAKLVETVDPSRAVIRELGERRNSEGKRLRGIVWEERNGGRGEVWFDVDSNLPVTIDTFQTHNGVSRQYRHGELEFDIPVPSEILAYALPEPENVDYESSINPRFELWRLHLKKLASRLEAEGLPGSMALIPRASEERLEGTYPGRLPGITQETGLWVRPIQEPLDWFVKSNWTPRGSIQIASDLGEFEINHDLITSNEHSNNERVRFVVESLGFEIAESVEEQSIWVATYDGRKLKPWESVKAPIANPDNAPLRPGMRSTWGSEWTLKALLDAFALRTQTAVIDETGIGDVAVASEAPYWNDSEASIALAKTWFRDEFGVTLTKEVREQPSYRVQRP